MIGTRKASALVDFAGDQVSRLRASPAHVHAQRVARIPIQPPMPNLAELHRPITFVISVFFLVFLKETGMVVGVQVVAYLMISAMSAAAPVTDYMRQKADNLFTDSAAAAISMAFFAFVAIGLSALVSGYSLSTEVLV
jgi:hypothetical protein